MAIVAGQIALHQLRAIQCGRYRLESSVTKTNPRKIDGPWADGRVLDLDSTGSEFLGYDEYGQEQFDTGANGADKAIQTYVAGRRYPSVLGFCTAGDCRNNVGNWPVRAIDAPHRSRDFAFFTAKDAAMADEADVLALWDGQSTGTLVNVARLVARSKPAVVYVAPAKTFSTLKTPDDLATLLSSADPDVRARAEEYIHDHVAELAQPQMF